MRLAPPTSESHLNSFLRKPVQLSHRPSFKWLGLPVSVSCPGNTDDNKEPLPLVVVSKGYTSLL